MRKLSRMAFGAYPFHGSAIRTKARIKDTVKDVCLSDDRSRIGKESLGAFTACWRPFGKPLPCGNPSKMYNRTMIYSYCAFDDTIPVKHVSDRASCMVQ